VLVVEDDASIRELLRLHLDLSGFAIDEADEGRKALDLARSTPFDLVLLDVMLPGLDGISVCRAIRTSGPNVDTPILMLTARWSDDTYVTDRTVDTVISRLRRKIERDPQDPEMLLTAWGVGYKFAD